MNRIIVASIFALALASALKTCYKGGCSGQLCSDQDGMISTCEWTARYGCYQSYAKLFNLIRKRRLGIARRG